jgi:hypothetical protein
VFLAMTDTMAHDGKRSDNRRNAASRLGPIRRGERWTIRFHGRSFDALYDPEQALIFAVTDCREVTGS